MSDYLPKHHAGTPITRVAAGAITGGRLTNVNDVVTAGADNTVLGVASHDAATGKKYGVYPLAGAVHRLVASAAIAKGAHLKSAAAGKVATLVVGTDSDLLDVGVALQAAAADGDVIEVQGRG